MVEDRWLKLILEGLFVTAGVSLLGFAAKRMERVARKADDCLRTLIDGIARRVSEAFRSLSLLP